MHEFSNYVGLFHSISRAYPWRRVDVKFQESLEEYNSNRQVHTVLTGYKRIFQVIRIENHTLLDHVKMDNVLSANFPRLHKTVKTLHAPPCMGIFL